MAYRVPKYELTYDPKTVQWICSSDEFNMTTYDDFPQAAISRFHMMFQSICHDHDDVVAKDLEKFRVL